MKATYKKLLRGYHLASGLTLFWPWREDHPNIGLSYSIQTVVQWNPDITICQGTGYNDMGVNKRKYRCIGIKGETIQ